MCCMKAERVLCCVFRRAQDAREKLGGRQHQHVLERARWAATWERVHFASGFGRSGHHAERPDAVAAPEVLRLPRHGVCSAGADAG